MTRTSDEESPQEIETVPLDDLEGMWQVWQTAKACEEEWKTIRERAAETIKERMLNASVGLINGKPVIQHTYYTMRRLNIKKFRKESPKLYDAYVVEIEIEKFGPVTKTLAAAVEGE